MVDVDVFDTRPAVYEKCLGQQVSSRRRGHILFYAQRHGIGEMDLLRRIAAGLISLDEIEADHISWRSSSKRRKQGS